MQTPVTPDQFRADFPAFADEVLYPDSVCTMWLNAAVNMVNTDRWGAMATIGQELWAAHNIVLDARDQAAAGTGGIAGEMTGAVNSKAVDRVSVGYDTSAATLRNAGDYALTTYGTRYLKLARMFGAGGVQL